MKNFFLEDESIEFEFDKVYNKFELDLSSFGGSDRATYTLSLKGEVISTTLLEPSDLPLEIDGVFL